MIAAAFPLSNLRNAPWSADEEAMLREHLPTLGSKRTAELMGRSQDSVLGHARKLGLLSGRFRRWTEREDKQLFMLWGSETPRELAAKLGRTTYSVCWRAGQLGLEREYLPDTASVTKHSERFGYDQRSLRRILEWAGAQKAVPIFEPRPGSKSRPAPYDISEVEDAVERWLASEFVGPAAKRRGMDHRRLTRILNASGLEFPARPGRGQYWRIPTKTIDEAIAIEKATKAHARDVSRRDGSAVQEGARGV